MKTLVTAFATLLLILGAFQVFAPRAGAQGAAPSWSNGDWWEYVGSGTSSGVSFSVTLKQTMVDKVPVTVGGLAYETYHCTVSVSMTVMGMTATVSGDSYTRTSDLADVKLIVTSNVGTASTTTITWEPPAGGLPFPLTNGRTWLDSTTELTVVNPGYASSRTMYNVYNASGPQRVAVPAGHFDAYIIQMKDQWSDNNKSTAYYSDAVGNALTMTTPLSQGMSATVELKSYFYAEKAFLRGLWWVLAIVVVVVLAVATVIVVIRRRRRARLAQPSQPAGSVYGQPQMQQPPSRQPYQPPYQPPQPPPKQP